MDAPHIERMKTEYEELATKANKLSEFLESDEFKELDEDRRRLLQQQNELMVLYVDVLGKRLAIEGYRVNQEKKAEAE